MIESAYGNSMNFMTPDVKEYGWIVPQKVAYEISTGRGFDSDMVAGVSIVENGEKSEKSTSFTANTRDGAIEKARDYIRELEEEFK